MSHEIYPPFDRVFSTEGTEWHGLAEHHTEITDEVVNPILIPLICGPTYVQVGTNMVQVPNRQTLVADLSKRLDVPEDERYIPLHTPSNSYKPIENRQVWELLQRTAKEFGFRVVSAGTLDKCAKFFASLDIGSNTRTINKEQHKFYMAYLTSHDGTHAAQAYDTSIRPICANTVRLSLEQAGDIGCKVFHTANADVALDRFPELINNILAGREAYCNQLEYFASVPVSREDALYIAMSFLCQKNKTLEDITKQQANKAEEIQHLFCKGMGNRGMSLYDLYNAGTEMWTHGSGVGKRSSKAEKAAKANFGAAADHKNDWMNYLMGDTKKFAEIGKRLMTMVIR